jgi:hypothetical protein
MLKSNTKLYHKDIYLPQDLIDQAIHQQQTTTNFAFTKHLIERIECKDRSHNSVTAEKVWTVLSKLKENPIIPFEVETETHNQVEKVTKYVVRDKCNMFEDISIVIRGNKVITAYINNSTDEHFTLDTTKYVKF